MKPLKKKAVVLLAALLLSVFLLQACVAPGGEEDTTVPETTVEKVTIAGNGVAYTILRGDDCPGAAADAIYELKNLVKSITGAEMGITAELLYNNAGRTDPVILIAGTKTADKNSGQKNGDWGVYLDADKNILIWGGSGSAISEAVKSLEKYVDKETGVFAVPADLNESYSGEYKLDITINGSPISSAVLVYEASSSYAKAAAEKIKDSIENLTGHSLKIQPDTSKGAACEILVGSTSRTTEDKLFAGKERPETVWFTGVVDGNYCIAANNPYSIDAAVNALVKALGTSEKGTLELTSIVLSGDVVKSAKAAEKAEGSIRIMTSNVLWTENEKRSYAVRAEIIDGITELFTPDVICFNEYYGTMATQLTAKLSDDYDVIFPSYDDNWNGDFTGYTNSLEKLQQHVCATPIAVRKDSELTVVASGFRYTSEKWWIHSISWMVLKTSDGKLIGVTANHYGEQTVGNFSLDTLECINDVNKQYGDIPFVITGDLYFWAGETPYNTMTAAGYKNAFESSGKVVGCGSYHQVGDILTGTDTPIDHILYDSRLTCTRHHLIADNVSKWCSDHFPIYSDFIIK